MPYVLERHKVQDYDKWKAVFDADTANREASGSRGAQIFRSADDPTEVVVLFEWDSLQRARERIQSTALRQKFHEAGVAGGVEQTEFYLLEEVGSVRA
jgi:heme-degrading monooxygenase HmoA